MADKISISTYDTDWPRCFELERQRLMSFCSEVTSELVHFGSTAVPALAAKPIIDMMAPITDLRVADEYSEALLHAEYKVVDADFARRRLFHRASKSGHVAFNLHLVLCPDWPIKNELLFRDWLIQHPKDAKKYEALKLRLANEHAGDVEQYTEGKSAFVQGVVNRARAAQGLSPETDWSE